LYSFGKNKENRPKELGQEDNTLVKYPKKIGQIKKNRQLSFEIPLQFKIK
jgi:hypothetical protein